MRQESFSARSLGACATFVALGFCLTIGGCGLGTTSAGTSVPLAVLSVTSLAFSSPAIGTAAGAQTVTLSNSGTGALASIAVSISGSSDFSATTTCGSTLAAGGACTISVNFTPTSTGAATGALSIADSAAGSPQTVALTGALTGPQAVLSATTLTYAATTIGTSAGVQTVVLANPGTATLAGIAISLAGSGAFSQTNNCGTSLVAGGTCTVSVNFTPTVAGAVAATLSVADSAAGSPQMVAISGSGLVSLSACAAAVPPVVSTSTAGVAMKAVVLAGVAPVVGASVQLYAAGTAGLGSTPTALGSAVATDSTGTASIPAGYSFPSATSQVYLVARGGKVGGATASNAAIVLLTALGTGNQIASGSTFTVNEVTTAAATYALAQFMAAGGAIGATSTNATGLANAFSTSASLACASAGASPGSTFPSNGTSPAPRIDSLANLLNACTAAVTANACTQLFSNTTLTGKTAPGNTLDAVLNLVRNPAANAAALYTLSTASAVYSPVLSMQPNDWTLFVAFTGGGMDSPSGIGIDSLGNVRVANYFNVASAFTPIGAPLYANGVTGSGLDNSYGLAVDASNNAWIPNEQSPYSYNSELGSVSVFNTAGASVAGANGYYAGGLNYPIAVAIDPNTTAWVVDYGNSHVTLLNASGVPVSGTSGYTTPLFAFPVAVAIDANHYGWIANQSSNTVTKVAPDGSSFTNFSCCNGASGIAVDPQNNVWVANFYGNSVSQINATTGAIVGNQSYTAGGTINHPQGIAVDGAGNIWLTNFRAGYLTELAGSNAPAPGAALSPATGYAPEAALLEAYAIAIDASGNLWITNFGNNTVTEFVGLAVPVKTPLLGLPQLP